MCPYKLQIHADFIANFNVFSFIWTPCGGDSNNNNMICLLMSINCQFLRGGDFKNKQKTKQLFEQEYNCLNNCLSSKTITIKIKYYQKYNCFIINVIV